MDRKYRSYTNSADTIEKYDAKSKPDDIIYNLKKIKLRCLGQLAKLEGKRLSGRLLEWRLEGNTMRFVTTWTDDTNYCSTVAWTRVISERNRWKITE